MKGRRTGHTCPLCHIHTFHNHCGTCGYTAEEAESALLSQLNGIDEIPYPAQTNIL